jgi:glycosyltransferase involved in cell wall biosynthesis
VPVLLWFTHWKASRLLRLGERLSTAVLTVDRTTFPLDSPKVVEIGHGIDVEAFSCTDPPNGKGVSLLALGRYSPAKGLPVVVRAVQVARKAGVDLRLDVYGPAPLEADAVHRRELEALTSELGLADVVAFHDALPPAEVRERLRKADALVNNMRPGAADKVVFEAGAACRPSFAAAHAFGRLLPDSLRFPSDDVDALARRLVDFSRLPVELRADLGRDLRARVRAEHSVDHWADQVVAAAWR